MRVNYEHSATLYLQALPEGVKDRIVNKISFFAEQTNPRSFGRSLTNIKAFRFRVGDHRVICEIDQDVITVLVIGKRDDIYRDL